MLRRRKGRTDRKVGVDDDFHGSVSCMLKSGYQTWMRQMLIGYVTWRKKIKGSVGREKEYTSLTQTTGRA